MQKYEIPIPSPLDELPEDSLPAFPYHDPAMGCEFRLHQPSRDFLDYAFSQVQPDQRPPLQVLHERHRWQEAEAKRRHLWERFYPEVHPPFPKTPEAQASFPATVVRAPREEGEEQGLVWLLS
mmetsp:Transcript_59881/g.159273  ORF Transcript_59881/g.159273 Transcript_59881/m.159273 type:complete len:123 (+) Transcript_59881:573-941(+)